MLNKILENKTYVKLCCSSDFVLNFLWFSWCQLSARYVCFLGIIGRYDYYGVLVSITTNLADFSTSPSSTPQQSVGTCMLCSCYMFTAQIFWKNCGKNRLHHMERIFKIIIAQNFPAKKDSVNKRSDCMFEAVLALIYTGLKSNNIIVKNTSHV